MPSDSDDLFVPIKDADGNVTGMMDQATADYLASTAPNPTQSSIDALLATITGVRVVPVENRFAGATEQRTLLDTSDPVSVAAFRQCFAIVEDTESFGHCMCVGDPHFELLAGGTLTATIGYHHGYSIRWDAWKYDAYLQEPDKLLDWLSDHGIDGPRQEVEESRRRGEESRRQRERWLAVMPACFQPFWDDMASGGDRDPRLQRQLLDALESEIPDQVERAAVLFELFGSGVGSWSGYPAYESAPEQLLLYFPTPILVQLLVESVPTEAQWRGAARYFGGWDFGRVKKGEAKLLSPELKKRFLEAARSTGFADTIERAERAFGG